MRVFATQAGDVAPQAGDVTPQLADGNGNGDDGGGGGVGREARLAIEQQGRAAGSF